MSVPTRPVLRWHGGKWKLAPWIISHFPKHRVYVEPYGGAASVLLRKVPSFSEIYNDLDSDVVNLFRILREPAQAARLIELLCLTPFAREEFELSYLPDDDPVERARRLIVRSYQGHGSDSATSPNSGFRAQSPGSGRSPEKDWSNYPPALTIAARRLAAIVVEHRPALQVMARHDASDTLHYLDPTYLHETRSTKVNGGGRQHGYRHEMSADDHAEMLNQIKLLDGFVVLSGYPAEIYDTALMGWRRDEVEAMADGGRPRTEVLWLNPACAAALDRDRNHGTLFQIKDEAPSVSEGSEPTTCSAPS